MPRNFYVSEYDFENVKMKMESEKARNGHIIGHACLSRYSGVYDKDAPENFYFGFYMKPRVAQIVVNNFNSVLKNIRIEILYQEFFGRSKGDSWNGDRVGPLTEAQKRMEKFDDSVVEFSLYRFYFSESYSKFARYCLTISICQLMREYGSDYYKSFQTPTNPEYTLKEAVEISNNTGGIYGNWSKIQISYENALLQDDPELMNELLVPTNSDYYYGSGLTESYMPYCSTIAEKINTYVSKSKKQSKQEPEKPAVIAKDKHNLSLGTRIQRIKDGKIGRIVKIHPEKNGNRKWYTIEYDDLTKSFVRLYMIPYKYKVL